MALSPRRLFVLVAVAWMLVSVALYVALSLGAGSLPNAWVLRLVAATWRSIWPAGVLLVNGLDALGPAGDSMDMTLGLVAPVMALSVNALFWAVLVTGVVAVARRLWAALRPHRPPPPPAGE